jgi:hypothetical protein
VTDPDDRAPRRRPPAAGRPPPAAREVPHPDTDYVKALRAEVERRYRDGTIFEDPERPSRGKGKGRKGRKTGPSEEKREQH